LVERISLGRRSFIIANYTFLILLGIMCVLPLVHVFSISLSSSAAATAGLVKLWPVEWSLKSYEYVLSKQAFLKSVFVSTERVVLGVSLNLLLTVLVAYPLSKEPQVFRWRTAYVWFFVFTILFGGGLVPWYMVIKATGIMDSVWALILPGAVPVFNVILLLNFFRGLPKELEEAAFIDGAGYLVTLWKVIIPLSAPAIATITLFSTVGHWNSWFDGMILMNKPDHYPLQTYLRTVVIERDLSLMSLDDLELMSQISDRTTKAAQIFLGSLPILLVYPFLQKYFMKGIVLGSVKG